LFSAAFFLVMRKFLFTSTIQNRYLIYQFNTAKKDDIIIKYTIDSHGRINGNPGNEEYIILTEGQRVFMVREDLSRVIDDLFCDSQILSQDNKVFTAKKAGHASISIQTRRTDELGDEPDSYDYFIIVKNAVQSYSGYAKT
jgi:hypothetical protein